MLTQLFASAEEVVAVTTTKPGFLESVQNWISSNIAVHFQNINIWITIVVVSVIVLGIAWFVMSARKIRWKPTLITEIAIACTLSLILGFFKIGQLPQGGSISLAMLPVIVVAFRRGLVPGVVCGVIAGFLQMLPDPFLVHPLQILLDYPFAWGALGLAGVIVDGGSKKKFTWIIGIISGLVILGVVVSLLLETGFTWDRIVTLAILLPFLGFSLLISSKDFKSQFGAVALASLGRFFFHFLSGVFFFSQFTPPGHSVVGYVVLYIFSHLGFEAVITAFAIIPLKRSTNLMKSQDQIN
jgi:thiamine transporter